MDRQLNQETTIHNQDPPQLHYSRRVIGLSDRYMGNGEAKGIVGENYTNDPLSYKKAWRILTKIMDYNHES